MAETVLPGGNTVGAVLVGDVVHKVASPWTPTVHALLRHLEKAGFEGAPRALGFDGQGREMLSYLPGETIGGGHWPAWVHAESTLPQVARWLRRMHDLTADFTPPAGERWFTGSTMAPGLVVGHHDAAPYNAVMDGDRLVGFFDWDTASPSTRELDLSYSALLWVPLTARDAGEPPLSEAEVADRRRRFHAFLDAYGYDGDRGQFAVVMPERTSRHAAVIRSMHADGDPVGTALLPIAGRLERSATLVQALPDEFWKPAT